MADPYLAISAIANDGYMQERVRACAVQQTHLGNVSFPDPVAWVQENRYVWAASPGWADSWDYALQTNWNDPVYQPGHDATVITDAQILATIQALGAPQ